MCGRFVLFTDVSEIQKAFSIKTAATEVESSYNVAPTQTVATVVQRDGQRALEAMRWGLIPIWAKDISIGSRMINARAETLAEKNSFKRPLKSQRCLVVADGFYEWRKDGAQKTPMFIRLKSKRPFGFAGLYDTWQSPDGAAITSCTIITTTPNDLLRPIHDRMPVILPKKRHKEWLDPSHQDLDALASLLQPYPADEIEAY